MLKILKSTLDSPQNQFLPLEENTGDEEIRLRRRIENSPLSILNEYNDAVTESANRGYSKVDWNSPEL